MPTARSDSCDTLLNAAFRDLDWDQGRLLSAVSSPERADSATASAWLEKGEWLSLAERIGVEKVFFVRDNPVLVIARARDSGLRTWQRLFRDAWCMARPLVLFLATDGELAAYDLTKGPSPDADGTARTDRLIDVAHSAAEIQQSLAKFRRDRIESGRLFEEHRFGDDRADATLVRDIQTVRRRLTGDGLDPTHANALIGRSIFIRYLEDRHILDRRYFRDVAKAKMSWTDCLESAPKKDSFGLSSPLYPYVLNDKDFTYALFDRLAIDFNGDIFPVGDCERQQVTPNHLSLLSDLLLGKADRSLFFFAYKFDVVPIELISNIYEEFLRSRDGGKPTEGSYYTRSSLVEFLLNQTLTEDLLETRPRIMDSAAGSGIFLVESFRRLVRHRVRQLGRAASRDELRDILRDQIAGIDINPEAVRVAAFSLYLALLHYLDPPTIRKNRLPCLVYPPDGVRLPDREYLDILVAGNAFEIEKSVAESDVQSRFGSACADVVVGNPPWGTPTGNDPLAAASREGASRWCRSRELALGDKELSQAFIHRTMDLLKDDGEAALLVSTGVFFKRHENSRTFRRQWLERAILQQVVNFAAVRQFFFQRPSKSTVRSESDAEKDGAISPFASVRFRKAPPNPEHRFQYWSVKRTGFVEDAEAVVLSRTDVHWVSQQELLADERLWKVYWWGGHRDAAFIGQLSQRPNLQWLVRQCRGFVRRGYQPQPPLHAAEWLTEFRELPTRAFTSLGPLPTAKFVLVPSKVFRRGERSAYEGQRILLKRGISEKGAEKGVIHGRLESASFCFRDSIYSIKLPGLEDCDLRALLGVFWSSFARYYFFLTSGRWGMWHNDLQKDTLTRLPVSQTKKANLLRAVSGIVSELEEIDPRPIKRSARRARRLGKGVDVTPEQLMLSLDGSRPSDDARSGLIDDRIVALRARLDDAVFDLYELSDEQRDLIRETCELGLDYLYYGESSSAVGRLKIDARARRFGALRDLTEARGIAEELREYIRVFLDAWEPRLKRQGGWLRWRIVLADGDASMLGIIFSTESADERLPEPADDDESAWRWILTDLAESCAQTAWAREVYIDGVLQLVTAHDIAIVKRNERRLWTRTAAREDAEATMAQVLIRSHKRGRKERA